MITITPPEKDTLQHCGWLRPRGLEGSIEQVPPVVELRPAKVVELDSIHRRNQRWHAFIPVTQCLVFFFTRKTLWRNTGGVCGWRALLLLWSLTPLLWSFAGQVQAVVLVRNCK